MSGILATFSDLKIIRTRKVAQLVFEVALEEADAALRILGGVPMPDREQWVGIAPVNPTTGAAHSAPAGAPSRQIPEPTATPVSSIARPDIGTDPGLSVFTGDQFGAGQMPPGPSQDEASAADRARHKGWGDKPSNRAAQLTHDVAFWKWAGVESAEDADAFIKRTFHIASKAQLDERPALAAKFAEMVGQFELDAGRIPRP